MLFVTNIAECSEVAPLEYLLKKACMKRLLDFWNIIHSTKFKSFKNEMTTQSYRDYKTFRDNYFQRQSLAAQGRQSYYSNFLNI